MTEIIQTDFEDLELMVDKYGLPDVLDALSRVCSEKAEHVRTDWQHEALARIWERRMMLLDGLVARLIKVEGGRV